MQRSATVHVEMEKIRAGTHVAVPRSLLLELMQSAERLYGCPGVPDREVRTADNAVRAAVNIVKRYMEMTR